MKGIKNGDRKYLVDFTGGINLGSYHIVDGARVTISYSGQFKKCGRCQKTAREMSRHGYWKSQEMANTIIHKAKANHCEKWLKSSEEV